MDTFEIGGKTYYNVYRVEGVNDPVISKELNSAVAFYFTKNDALLQLKTKGGIIWSISGEI
ncbi:MAG: hypothetical protein JXJ22_09400 [Bacteroidales bacterium]|nr:hypothetical protein [Bacteroidales bacterium]